MEKLSIIKDMGLLLFLILIFSITVSSLQYYDTGSCQENKLLPGSRYTCGSTKSCSTYIVYRSQPKFNTVASISTLFTVDQDQVLFLNNLTNSSQILEIYRDVVIPIGCSCSGAFYQANFSYSVTNDTSYSEISCGMFEGLVKYSVLEEENHFVGNGPKKGVNLNVPIKCACPDDSYANEVKFLVTYPLVENDRLHLLSKRFNIDQTEITRANSLNPTTTIFPNTTIVIPLRKTPSIAFDASNLPMPFPNPDFNHRTPAEASNTSVRVRKIYILGLTIGITLMIILLVGFAYYFGISRKWRSSTHKSSPASCLSPDLIIGMSMLKSSIISYSVAELKEGTGDFHGSFKIGASTYKGKTDGIFEAVIKQMSFADARRTVAIYSKINHANIVRLLGVCYGEGDHSSSYVVFEFVRNGCLRDCLSNQFYVLSWKTRTQIAFDVAIGLHYIHHCTFPSYIHMNINSRNILITETYRVKIAGLGAKSLIDCSKDTVVPSVKVDVYGFGVVLFELISGDEAVKGTPFKESLGFLGEGGGEGDGFVFERLKGLVDPCLEEDYPNGEALCLAVLAKACVEDDPLHRPSMDYVLKILARMV